jgi:hypothetical protein
MAEGPWEGEGRLTFCASLMQGLGSFSLGTSTPGCSGGWGRDLRKPGDPLRRLERGGVVSPRLSWIWRGRG